MKKILFILTVAIMAVLPALSQAETFKFDDSHTSIGFRIRHMGISEVSGGFDKFEGTVVWDGKTADNVKVDVTIQAASIDTRIAKRDEHLRSADFFDVAKYSTLTFKSKKAVASGKDEWKLVGDLTIKGVTKEVVLDVRHLGTISPDPWNMTRAGFHAETIINRRDFGVAVQGLTDKAVGDDVKIVIDTELVRPVK